MNSSLSRWSPVVLSILRIVVGLLIMEHGTQKLFNFPPAAAPHEGGLQGLMLIGAWMEFVGGIVVVARAFHSAGCVSSLAAKWPSRISCFTRKRVLSRILNHGESAVVYCFVFLFFVFAGAGPWSIDAMWNKGGAPNRV